MLPQRFRWVGRRRYELVGLAVAVTLGLLHWATDGRQAGAGSGPVAGVLRVLSALEGRASDLQMWARGIRAPHPDVVVAAIDPCLSCTSRIIVVNEKGRQTGEMTWDELSEHGREFYRRRGRR